MNIQSLHAHIGALEEKHKALEKEIDERITGKVFDDMEMQALKQRKLGLKDEIEKCRLQLAAQ